MQTYKKQIRHFSTQSLKHKLGSDVEDEEEGADVICDVTLGFCCFARAVLSIPRCFLFDRDAGPTL